GWGWALPGRAGLVEPSPVGGGGSRSDRVVAERLVAGAAGGHVGAGPRRRWRVLRWGSGLRRPGRGWVGCRGRRGGRRRRGHLLGHPGGGLVVSGRQQGFGAAV